MQRKKKPPLLTAVMVTGKSPDREKLGRISVKTFLDQTYRNRELVIVNAGNYELRIGHPAIREVKAKESLSLGELRNIGIEEAKGDWIIQWDDDDYHHPHRMLYQMAHRQEDTAQVLAKQIRVDVTKGEAICCFAEDGMPGTLLHPAKTDVRYAPGFQDEVRQFIQGFKHKVIVDNDSDTWPGPALYTRFFHGSNTRDHKYMMGGHGSFNKKWNPNKHERDYVTDLLQHYGLEVAW